MAYDFLIKMITVVLGTEAVILCLIFIGYLSTLTQKTLKEVEAAKAQAEAWQASTKLNEAVLQSTEEAKKDNKEALAKIVATALSNSIGIPPAYPTTH